MVTSFDQFQKFGQGSLDATVKALGAFSNNAQAIAVESAEFAKKSFEQGTSTFEKLVEAQTLDKAIEIQTNYLKTAYDSVISQSAKMGTLYSTLATESFKPFESLLAGKTA